MTSPVETWVAHVAKHTGAKSVHWLDAAFHQLSKDFPNETRRDVRPSMIVSARRREDVSLAAEFLTRAEATARFWPALRDCMKGRAMYVLPYVLGRDTRLESAGVQITDDPQLVVAFARTVHLDHDGVRRSTHFVRSVHAVRAPCPPAICCFADGDAIWAPSVASSDLLDARPHALRLATLARPGMERLAARMAVVRVPRGRGEPLHFGIIAPSAFGRQSASLLGAAKHRRYRVLGGEVAWLTNENDRLHAVLCERPPPAEDGGQETVPSTVPLDALVYCTRRASAVPLVLELTGWAHGCYAGAMLAADADATASVDAMGMSAFCGIDLGEYLDRWLALGARVRQLPKLFQLNWFLRGSDGSLLWPGLFEGWRIAEWMIGRLEGRATGRATAAGFVPTADAIERAGLRCSDESLRLLFDVAPESWTRELEGHAQALATLGRMVPLELRREHRFLTTRFEEALAAAARDKDPTS